MFKISKEFISYKQNNEYSLTSNDMRWSDDQLTLTVHTATYNKTKLGA